MTQVVSCVLVRRFTNSAGAACLLSAVLAGLPGCVSGRVAAGADAPAPGRVSSLTPDQVRAIFEKFKQLDSEWDTRSTKGWGGRLTYRVVAGGSCVMETDNVAHPGRMMVSMIHPDGDRLLLTHYCVGGSQPRLVATKASADLSEVTFEFLDAGNLRTRDEGHMDKAVFRFRGPDEFTARWTWYEAGQESWMEEISHLRVRG